MSFKSDIEEGIEEVWRCFNVSCRKCGSGSDKTTMDVHTGHDYGPPTGGSPGSVIFECKGCGNKVDFYT